MSTPPDRPAGDPPRDAHLLQALRHAPDRDVEPPPELSARILASAHATMRSAPSARGPRGGVLARLREALTPRTPWTPALATVVVAALVGLLWSVAHLDEGATGEAPAALPRSAEQGAPGGPVATVSPPTPPAPKPTASTTPAPGTAATRDAAPPPPAAPSAEARQRAAPAEIEAASERRAAPPPMPTQAAAKSAAEATAPPAAATPNAPPAAAPSGANAELASRSVGAASDRGVTGAADPVLRLDALIAAQWADVAWRHAQRVHGHGVEQRRFWLQLRDATRGRWEAVPGATAAAPGEPWLAMSIEGRRTALFWLDGGTLWLRWGTGVWRLQPGADELQAWQQAPAAW